MSHSLDEWETAIAQRVRAAMPDVTVTQGVMPDTPDRCVTVKAYLDDDSHIPGNVRREIRVQVRTRQAPDAPVPTANKDAEADTTALRGHGIIMGDLPACRISRLSTAMLGADERRRDERVDNMMIITTTA